MDNDQTIDNMNDIVTGFSNFFVSVGPKLAEEIKILQPEEGKGIVEDFLDSNLSSMFLRVQDELEILDIVNNSNGMALIKKVIDAIAEPLAYICNLSFKTGVFPNKRKTAKVIPLYKDGDRKQFTNYRTVSLLSQFSKILEKIFASRLENEKNWRSMASEEAC